MNQNKATCLLLLLLSALAGHSQLSAERQAVMMLDAASYQRGVKGKPFNPSKAFALHVECARAGNVKAMHAVGLHYSEGSGTTANRAEALKWHQLAADNGYARAWYDAGNLYQRCDATEQDFVKAYQHFSKGAAMGDKQSSFSMGYLLYKGLGCMQNYEQAYRIFHQLAQDGHVNSMYFLGLCLRNGYGTRRNADAARQWLQKASAKGNRQAAEELTIRDPENPVTPIQLPAMASQVSLFKTVSGNNVLNSYERIRHNVTSEDLRGEYSGYAIRYDWSGRHIVSVTPLQLVFTESEGAITGQWKENDTEPVSIAARLTEQGLEFADTRITKTGHYSGPAGEQWQFLQAQMQVAATQGSLFIAGNLQLYSGSRKEPGKPMYMILSRKDAHARPVAREMLTRLQTFPNPVVNRLTVQFDLAETNPVSIRVTNMDGKTIYTEATSTLLPGSYRRNMPVTGAAGSYAVTITAGNTTKTLIVVKQ